MASLHFSGSPTNTGTMCVWLCITGRPAARQHRFGACGAVLMALALRSSTSFEMADRGRRRRADRRRQGGGEDEARRVGAHGVDQRRAAGDVAAETAKGLAQRSFHARRCAPIAPSRSAMPPPRGPYMPTA